MVFSKPGDKQEGTATEFFANLGAGWNLGNSLDAHDDSLSLWDEPAVHETIWGNPQATQALFRAVRSAGFDTVRIPVTWYSHMDERHQVDEAWMARVQQVVDDALASGLFVILNAHHEDWYTLHSYNLSPARERMAALWEQVAHRFSDYDTKLIFEGLNEPRMVGTEWEWTQGTEAAWRCLNQLNQVFVDTIRSAPGQNPGRYLLIPTYCASPHPDAVGGLAMPEDERLGVSVHLYTPFDFAHDMNGTSAWSREDEQDTSAIDGALACLDQHLISNGVPVVVTEYGAVDKNNEDDRAQWASHLTQTAAGYGIPCVWWDNGMASDSPFTLIDRSTGELVYPGIVEAITAAKPEA